MVAAEVAAVRVLSEQTARLPMRVAMAAQELRLPSPALRWRMPVAVVVEFMLALRVLEAQAAAEAGRTADRVLREL